MSSPRLGCWHGRILEGHLRGLQVGAFLLVSSHDGERTSPGLFLIFKRANLIQGFPRWLSGKNLPANTGDEGSISGSEDPLERGKATHSSILAWRSPWTEEPGRQQSMGSQRIRHDLVMKQQQSHLGGFALIKSSKPSYHPKASPPNSITLAVRAST